MENKYILLSESFWTGYSKSKYDKFNNLEELQNEPIKFHELNKFLDNIKKRENKHGEIPSQQLYEYLSTVISSYDTENVVYNDTITEEEKLSCEKVRRGFLEQEIVNNKDLEIVSNLLNIN